MSLIWRNLNIYWIMYVSIYLYTNIPFIGKSSPKSSKYSLCKIIITFSTIPRLTNKGNTLMNFHNAIQSGSKSVTVRSGWVEDSNSHFHVKGTHFTPLHSQLPYKFLYLGPHIMISAFWERPVCPDHVETCEIFVDAHL